AAGADFGNVIGPAGRACAGRATGAARSCEPTGAAGAALNRVVGDCDGRRNGQNGERPASTAPATAAEARATAGRPTTTTVAAAWSQSSATLSTTTAASAAIATVLTARALLTEGRVVARTAHAAERCPAGARCARRSIRAVVSVGTRLTD